MTNRPDPSGGPGALLTPEQTASLIGHLDQLGTNLSPAELLVEIETWAAEQNDPTINQWLWTNQTAANPTSEGAGVSSGLGLRDHLNHIDARNLSYHQAAHFGVELVHHPDSDHHQIFHTADGDIVYWSNPNQQWDLVANARTGPTVISGEFTRTHTAHSAPDAHIHDTATVAESATVEAGARIGPHATIGEHAHIGVDTTIASYARVEDGAFIGSFTTVWDGSRIGPGAVIGTGTTIGSTTNIGAGARLAQNTRIDAFDNIAANSHATGSARPTRERNSYRTQQVAALVDRIAHLDRD